MARAKRRGDREEWMREGAGDVALGEVLRAALEVARARLKLGVVRRRDAEAENVDRLLLTAEAGGQLLRDEDVGPIRDLQAAVDSVVIGDGDEVHPARLGERIDLFGRGRAFREVEGPLDAELRDG